MSNFNSREFRNALGCFTTGITIVTTNYQNVACGMTVNSFASVSLDPPFVLWSLDNEASSYEVFSEAKFYNIHVLGESQEELSIKFANPESDKFDNVEWVEDERGVPLISGCKTVFHCEQEASYPGGDHLILMGRVFEIVSDNGDAPLLFSQGKYSRLES